MNNKITINDVISTFGSGYVLNGETYDGLDWQSVDITKPTEKEITDKIAEVQAEYDAQAYSRNRKADYPDWGTQLNKIYDDGITKWKSEMVDPVKAKWPKDNSGPK